LNKHFFCAFLASAAFLFLDRRLASGADPELVSIKSVDPSIMIELRYATVRNVAGRPLYSADMPALLRPHVAAQLAEAQATLRGRGYGLKIWDAYRPQRAHEQLWAAAPKTDYVADPAAAGGSLHTWGVAVDATMVDRQGREVSMPTDFDDFTPAAMLRYTGRDPSVRQHLLMLQYAMGRAGFYGMRTEWWHFISKEWKFYRAVPEIGGKVPPPPPPLRAVAIMPPGPAPVKRSSPPASVSNQAGRPLPRAR